MPIQAYDATSATDLNRALADIEAALAAAPPVEEPQVEATAADAGPAEVVPPDFDIPEFSQLIGIQPEVYQQIRAALKSGKRHLMFYGPPGTGKTSLAELVAGHLHTSHTMVTGSADWSSQDIIGGYQPTGGTGGVRFTKGVLLENFDQPLIIDELNRCDIDRVLGPLFTVLSGQPTTLPYLIDPANDTSERFVILPTYKTGSAPHECAPTQNWRLLATINSIDKASLYQLSYALTRRFAWILVDAPADLHAFVREFCALKGYVAEDVPADAPIPLADIWAAVNEVRPMGAAPFIDAISYCRAVVPKFDFFTAVTAEMQEIFLGAFQVFVLPMLDGIAHEQARAVAAGVAKAIELTGNDAADLERRLLALAL
jgi:5-methylcytosine-specific restriction protein B